MKKIIFFCLFVANLSAEPPVLTVNGEGSVFNSADLLTFTVGVETFHELASGALDENSQQIEKIIEDFKNLGLDSSEYKTGRFSIRPTYTVAPKNPSPDWKASINGFVVNNSLQVQTEKLERAGEIIQKSSHSGANQIGNLAFSLKSIQPYKGEAVVKATKDAIAKAEVLSEAAGVSLKRIVNISLDDARPPAVYKAESMLYSRAASNFSPPIEGGEIEVNASVTITYEIE